MAASPNLGGRRRRPVLQFGAATFAICLLMDEASAPPVQFTDDDFTYHQHDFFAYASRDDPPFHLEPLELPDELQQITCRFEAVTYGTTVSHYEVEQGSGEHRARLDVARVFFRPSCMSVLVVMLRLGESGSLNEFDIIRLAKLWEGGEGESRLDATRSSLALGNKAWVRFGRERAPQFDFAGLIDQARRACCPDARYLLRPPPAGATATVRRDRPYVTGCVQLETDQRAMGRLVAGLRSVEDPVAGSMAVNGGVLALSGILRALLAFHDTYPNELPSIFKETVVSDQAITAVHKGTFLRLAASMRMPSAYFILPHVIALHNEALLDRAAQAGADRLGTSIRHQKGRRLAAGRWGPLDDTRREINGLLDNRIDDAVIHYPNLRDLYERAARSRGLTGLATRAQRYADELRVEANTKRTSVQAWAQVTFAMLAVLIATWQLSGGGDPSTRPRPARHPAVRSASPARRAGTATDCRQAGIRLCRPRER